MGITSYPLAVKLISVTCLNAVEPVPEKTLPSSLSFMEVREKSRLGTIGVGQVTTSLRMEVTRINPSKTGKFW